MYLSRLWDGSLINLVRNCRPSLNLQSTRTEAVVEEEEVPDLTLLAGEPSEWLMGCDGVGQR